VIWQLCTQKLRWHPLIWLMDGYEHEMPYSTVSSWEKCMMFLCRDIIEVPEILKKFDQYLHRHIIPTSLQISISVSRISSSISQEKTPAPDSVIYIVNVVGLEWQEQMCICNKKTWKLHVGHLHCMQFWSRWTNTAILDHTRTIHNAQWGIYHTDKLRATTDAHFQHTIMRMLTLLGICILDQSSRIKWQKKHSQCGDFILPHWHEVCQVSTIQNKNMQI
jgi:hypothetical protein